MREYKFGEYTTLKFAIQNVTPILIDGQHRLRAIVASGVPMQFTVQLLKVANQAEIERAYSTIDSGKKRLPGDKMGAIDKELGLRRPDCKVLNSAVGVLLLGFKPLGPADPVELHIIAKDAEGLKGEMKLWAAAMHLMLACLAKAPRSNAHLFLRASVLAVALVTLRDQPEMAIRFWTAAAFDDGLRAGQPEKALLYWLRSNVVSLSPRLQHEAAIVCWNKFLQGKKLTTFHSGILRQTSIAGSPFKLRSFEAPADAA